MKIMFQRHPFPAITIFKPSLINIAEKVKEFRDKMMDNTYEGSDATSRHRRHNKRAAT